jgi:DNA-binding winged helix-turn-helix (wHTH) protein
MSQAELEREVAEKTGESIDTIRRHGFSLVTPLRVFDPEADEQFQSPQMVDWDQVEAARYARAA